MLRQEQILVILFVIASSITFSFIPEAFSQSYSATKLVLDPFPSQARAGEIITFSGQLLTSDLEYFITDATINIKDQDALDFDDYLVSTTTDSSGMFSVSWRVENTDSGDRQFSALILDFYGGFGGVTELNHLYNIAESNTVEIYAEFPGTNEFSKSAIVKPEAGSELRFASVK